MSNMSTFLEVNVNTFGHDKWHLEAAPDGTPKVASTCVLPRRSLSQGTCPVILSPMSSSPGSNSVAGTLRKNSAKKSLWLHMQAEPERKKIICFFFRAEALIRKIMLEKIRGHDLT